jgi:hypothetical protein
LIHVPCPKNFQVEVSWCLMYLQNIHLKIDFPWNKPSSYGGTPIAGKPQVIPYLTGWLWYFIWYIMDYGIMMYSIYTLW